MITLTFDFDSDLLVIPHRFSDAEFDKKTNPILKQIAIEFLTNFRTYFFDGVAPSFFGSPGIGKTHVAAVIAKKCVEHKIPVFWADTIKVLNQLMDYKDFRQISAYYKLRTNLTQTPVVVLDDFGHMQEYTRTKESFFEIVNARYSSKLPTIFTANYDLDENVKSWEQLSAQLSPALSRRIRQMSKGLLYAG